MVNNARAQTDPPVRAITHAQAAFSKRHSSLGLLLCFCLCYSVLLLVFFCVFVCGCLQLFLFPALLSKYFVVVLTNSPCLYFFEIVWCGKALQLTRGSCCHIRHNHIAVFCMRVLFLNYYYCYCYYSSAVVESSIQFGDF